MLSSTPESATRSPGPAAARGGEGRSTVRLAVRRFWRNANARAGLVLILLFALIAIFAPLIAPYGYDDENLVNRLKPPSASVPNQWAALGGLSRLTRFSSS